MAGIPHHAADGYIARLVQAGQKIAICEQLEGAGQGQEAPAPRRRARHHARARSPTRPTSSGTRTTSSWRWAAPAPRPGVALLDVSTGEFWVGEDGRRRGRRAGGRAAAPPSRDRPAGAAARPHRELLARLQATGATLTFADPAPWSGRRAAADLCSHFGVTTLESFGVGDLDGGAAGGGRGARLRARHAGRRLGHLVRLQRLRPADCHDARRDRRAHARAAGGQRRHARATRSSACSTRRSRRWARACCASGCCSRCSTSAPSAPARMPSPRWSTRPTARAALRAPAQAGRRPRAPDEPGHPRRRPRARPRRAARLPGAARRAFAQAAAGADGAAPGRGARGAGRPRRPAAPCSRPRSWTSRRSPCRTAGSSARAGATRCGAIVNDARRGARVDRRARGARARAHRAVEPARALQSRVRLRHRGDARAGARGCPPSTCAARR